MEYPISARRGIKAMNRSVDVRIAEMQNAPFRLQASEQGSGWRISENLQEKAKALLTFSKKIYKMS